MVLAAQSREVNWQGQRNLIIPSYLRLREKSKKISNDQELIQSDRMSWPQNQKGHNLIQKLTAVYGRHAR